MTVGSVKCFEDLRAWQAARELSKMVYTLTQKRGFASDRRLVSQIRAAAVSITSNIAEGFERSSAADFHHFLFMAKGSYAEVRSQLYHAKDFGYLTDEEFLLVMQRAQCVARLVGALREAVSGQIRR